MSTWYGIGHWHVGAPEALPIDMIEECPKPNEPGPEVPWECHNTKPVSAQAAWDAVVACCKGAK